MRGVERGRCPVLLALAIAAGIASAAAQDATSTAPPPRVAGIVHRDDGGSVAGARVTLTGFAHPELPPSVAWALRGEAEVKVEGVADDKGVFKIPLPHAGPFALLATSSDGKRARYRFPVMASDFVTLQLCPLCEIAGTVVDAAGRPAAGAIVDGASYSGTGISRERHAWCQPPLATTADDRGRFRLQVPVSEPDTLSVGARSVRAATPEHWAWERLYRIDGQSLSDVVLELERSRHVTARVVSAAGNTPLAGAEIVDVEETHGVARSGVDGGFGFDNLHGAALVVHAPGHAVQGFLTRGAAANAALAMRAPNAAALARVGVCALQPGAVVRARVVVAGASGPRRVLLATRDSQQIGFHFAWQAATAADGKLEVREARAGEPLYGFVEVDGRFVSFLQVVPGPEPIDLGAIHVDGKRSVTGVVLAHDGLRRAGALVMLQPVIDVGPGGPPGNGTLPAILSRITYTDRAGRFRFDGVPRLPHRCAVAAGFDGFRVLRLEADQDAGTVQMGEGASAAAAARLPDGTPAADASVQYLLPALDADHALFGSVYLLGRTDNDGGFVIRGLRRPASYTGWVMCARKGAGFISPMAGSATELNAVLLSPHSGRL